MAIEGISSRPTPVQQGAAPKVDRDDQSGAKPAGGADDGTNATATAIAKASGIGGLVDVSA